tara:strand:+ start:2476 stop:3411 length:936 start_codon:yes stop_codon:yes gene_type:complete
MQLIGKKEIQKIDAPALRKALEEAFVDFSGGRARSGGVGHLAFRDPPGDFHIKSSATAGQPFFTVKAAGSFYDNPARGLPSSNGAMLVFDATTGEPVACLADEGWLTDARTACAGAIAAGLIARKETNSIGIVGSGTQARMQAEWIAREFANPLISVWARDPAKARTAVGDLRAVGVDAVHQPDLTLLVRESDLVVTTTPSTVPLVTMAHARPGLRIVAVGADAPGKREIERDLILRCDALVVDSREQCCAYGECAGLNEDPSAPAMHELGEILKRDGAIAFAEEDIVIADLTGIGALDAAAASLVVSAAV